MKTESKGAEMHDFEAQFEREKKVIAERTGKTLVRQLPKIMEEICEKYDEIHELSLDLGRWIDHMDSDDEAVFTQAGIGAITLAFEKTVVATKKWREIEDAIKKTVGIE